MSDELDRIQRALEESGAPDDMTRDKPHEPQTAAERSRGSSFSRMRRNWLDQDSLTIARIEAEIDVILRAEFRAIYAVMAEIHKCVRIPQSDPATGEMRKYSDGSPMWEEDDRGLPVEDWSLFGDTTRSDLLWVITTQEGEWEAIAANLWARGMYAKTQWKEAFSSAFIHLPSSQVSGRPTVDDKTQHGNKFSAQDEYFAVFCSHLSKRAEVLVKSMDRIRWLLEKTTIS